MMPARGLANWVAWLLLMLSVTTEAADVSGGPPLQPTPEERVAQTIARELGLDSQLVQHDLQLLPHLSNLPPGTHVLSVKREITPGTWLIRLGCNAGSHCLPFDALLHTAELDTTHFTPPVPVNPGSIGLDRSSAREAKEKEASSSPPVVHQGEKVDMVLALGQVKLVVKAVCLNSGRIGDSIPVRNLSSHRLLRAEIAGPGLVRVRTEP